MTYVNNDTQFAIATLALKIRFEEIDAKTWRDVPEELKKESQELTGVELYPGRAAQAVELAQKMDADNQANWDVCSELETYEKEFFRQKRRDADYIQSVSHDWI